MGKCHILSCNLPTSLGINLPAGGVTLTLGVGIPCLITFLSYLVILKKLACNNIELSEGKEVKIITGVLIICYLVCILPIYIVEWIPFTEDQSPILSLGIYIWYWFIYIINVFVYILYSPSCRDAIRCFMLDILFILKLRKPHQLKESVNLSSLQDMSKIHKPNCLP